MVTVADASVAIRGDMSGFNTDLQRSEKAVGGFANRVSKSIKNTFSARNLLGAFGLAYGANQLVQFAGDAAQAYGELEQTVRTIDNVFGDSASIIHEWGATAAETAGMSQQTFMSSAAVMGETLTNMGFAQDEAAEKSAQLLSRAADLAIAFGKRPQDALLAITAAMRGERDTIEKFGIAIKQVDVNARISALGLDTSTAAAKKNAEAMAVVDLVLEQSSESAGRFADSQDDIAVKMAVTNARWADFVALDVGAAVASIQLGAFKVADATGDELDKLSTHFGDHFETIKTIAEEEGRTWDEVQKDIVQTMSETGQSFEEVTKNMTKDAQLAGAAIAMELPKGVQEAARLTALGGPVVADAWSVVGEQQQMELDKMIKAARAAGAENVVEFAAGMIDKQKDPLLAMEALAKANEEVLSRSAEISRLMGQLNSAELAAGLADGRPQVRQAARAAAGEIEARLRELGAWNWGYNTGIEYAMGLEASIPVVYRAAAGVASATGGQIGIRSEPEDPNSPLAGITKWGGNIVKTMAEGMYSEMSTASAAASELAGALVPSLPSTGMAGAGVGGAVGVVGAGKTYILQVDGKQYEFSSSTEMVGKLNEIGETWG